MRVNPPDRAIGLPVPIFLRLAPGTPLPIYGVPDPDALSPDALSAEP